jgi:hypothetical protein
MKKFDWDQTWVGLIIGLLSPVIMYGIYYLLIYNTGIKNLNVSLCVAANLIPFYVYQKKNYNKGLKGVFIVTFVWAILVAFLSVFTNYLHIG